MVGVLDVGELNATGVSRALPIACSSPRISVSIKSRRIGAHLQASGDDHLTIAVPQGTSWIEARL